jgi:hypothetical protein
MLIFGGNHGEMDTPTKMALVQSLNGIKMKNGWHHCVPHEKIYKLCRFGGSTLKTFGAEWLWRPTPRCTGGQNLICILQSG